MSGREAVLLGLLVAAGAGLFQWAGIALVPPRPGPVLGLLVGIACLAVAAPRILPAGTVRLARGLPSVIAARALFTAAFGATVTFIPLWLVSQRQMSQAEAGILLAVASLGWSAGSWAQGRDALAAVGHRLIPAGAICVAAAATGYSGMAAFDGPTVLALPAGALLGIGMGLGTSSQSVLTLRLAPAAQHPAASSALTLADTMGSVVGISLTGTVFASLASHPAHVTFTAVWVTAAAFGAWAIVAAFRVLPHDDRRPGHQVD